MYMNKMENKLQYIFMWGLKYMLVTDKSFFLQLALKQFQLLNWYTILIWQVHY